MLIILMLTLCRITSGVLRPECDSGGWCSSYIQAISNNCQKVKLIGTCDKEMYGLADSFSFRFEKKI